MPELLLLRHAKSAGSDPGQVDHDRPLAPRGRRAAPRMGALIREAGLLPDLVLCSSARRARETWELVAQALEVEPPFRELHALYRAAPAELVAAIRRTPLEIGRLLLVGHNPALESLARRLAGAGDAAALARLEAKFPTAALALLVFDGAWADLAPGACRLARFVRPKDL